MFDVELRAHSFRSVSFHISSQEDLQDINYFHDEIVQIDLAILKPCNEL